MSHDGPASPTARPFASCASSSAKASSEGNILAEYGLFDLNDHHFLRPALETLFDDELHVDQAIVGFIQGRARGTRRVVQVDLRRLESTGEVDVVLRGRGLDDFATRLWTERLASDAEERFGERIEILVERRGPKLNLSLD